MGVPGPSPLFIVGNFLDIFKKGFPKHDAEIMQKYGKTVGYFEGEMPVILTTDPNFIKSVMMKDFSCFINHRVSYPKFMLFFFYDFYINFCFKGPRKFVFEPTGQIFVFTQK
jgi:hypothetical protein